MNIFMNRKGMIGGHTIGCGYYVENGEKLFFTGKTSFQIKIPSSTPSDQWYVAGVSLKDAAGNQIEYQTWYPNVDENGHPIPDYLHLKIYGSNYEPYDEGTIPVSGLLTIKDEFDVDFEYAISNPNIASKISDMPEGAAAMIDFTANSATANKNWFDAIKGKDKTLVFSNDGIQWMINGKDITNDTKNINLNIVCEKANAEDFGGSGEVVILTFADNGTLPGKARIRIKSDYILGTGFNLYYRDGSSITLERSDGRGYLDGDDVWAEFFVTHNSTFVLSKNKLTKSNIVSSDGGNQSSTGSTSDGDNQSSTGSTSGGGSQPSTESSSGGSNQSSTGSSSGGGDQSSAETSSPSGGDNTAVEPAPTITKTPTSVKAKAKKNKVTVSWKKIKKTKKNKKLLAQIKGIQVQYANDPAFVQNPVTKKLGKNKTKVVLKLKKKTTYYIRVRYIGKDGASKWTKTKKVKTK